MLLVKHLLYTEKYTVDGARQKLDDHRRAGELRGAARDALRRETLGDLERELAAIVDVLEGRRPPRTAAEQTTRDRGRGKRQPRRLEAAPAW